MILLLSRCSFPHAAVRVRTWPSEALTDPDLHLCCLWLLHPTSYSYWNWIRQPPGKELEWIGHMNYDGVRRYSPSFKSQMSISRVTSKNEFSLQLSCVLLCWSHSDGTSVWAQTQTSLWGFPGSSGGVWELQGSFMTEHGVCPRSRCWGTIEQLSEAVGSCSVSTKITAL
jgi:hypothetical protein